MWETRKILTSAIGPLAMECGQHIDNENEITNILNDFLFKYLH